MGGGDGGLFGFDGRDLSLFWIGIGDFGCTGTRGERCRDDWKALSDRIVRVDTNGSFLMQNIYSDAHTISTCITRPEPHLATLFIRPKS